MQTQKINHYILLKKDFLNIKDEKENFYIFRKNFKNIP